VACSWLGCVPGVKLIFHMPFRLALAAVVRAWRYPLRRRVRASRRRRPWQVPLLVQLVRGAGSVATIAHALLSPPPLLHSHSRTSPETLAAATRRRCCSWRGGAEPEERPAASRWVAPRLPPPCGERRAHKKLDFCQCVLHSQPSWWSLSLSLHEQPQSSPGSSPSWFTSTSNFGVGYTLYCWIVNLFRRSVNYWATCHLILHSADLYGTWKLLITCS
jgi:hypothetical protein